MGCGYFEQGQRLKSRFLNQAELPASHRGPKFLCLKVSSQIPMKQALQRENVLDPNHPDTVCIWDSVFGGQKDKFKCF